MKGHSQSLHREHIFESFDQVNTGKGKGRSISFGKEINTCAVQINGKVSLVTSSVLNLDQYTGLPASITGFGLKQYGKAIFLLLILD